MKQDCLLGGGSDPDFSIVQSSLLPGRSKGGGGGCTKWKITEVMKKKSKDAEKEEVKHGQSEGSENVLLDKGDGDERRCLPEFAGWRRLWQGCDGGIRSGHAPPAAVEEQSF